MTLEEQIQKLTAERDAALKDANRRIEDEEYVRELREDRDKAQSERDAALKERDDAFATAKYFVEQNAIEVSKRGEAEHQVDLARGDLSEHIAKLECDAMAARVERDAALKACAEMRDVLGGCHNHGCFIKRPTGQATNGPCQCRRRAAEVLASTNCGNGYHHDDEWRPVVEALKMVVTHYYSTHVYQIAQQALAHAEKLTSQ